MDEISEFVDANTEAEIIEEEREILQWYTLSLICTDIRMTSIFECAVDPG